MEELDGLRPGDGNWSWVLFDPEKRLITDKAGLSRIYCPSIKKSKSGVRYDFWFRLQNGRGICYYHGTRNGAGKGLARIEAVKKYC